MLVGMTCFHPLRAYRCDDGLTFNPLRARVEGSFLTVPCGQCTGCRVARARDWAMRCSHEARLHEFNSFVTLTYSDDFFPEDASVSKRVMQLFMKRLRKAYSDRVIRFFGCGEYSPINKRPHYHLLLFNVFFEDQCFYKSNINNQPIYVSSILQKLWPFGFCTIGNVNYQTARYCAQYSLKKMSGELAREHYRWPHPLFGYEVRVEPEFALMSRRPGLGTAWFEKYSADCYPSDFLIVDGKRHPVPKFYDLKFKQAQELALEQLKRVRKRKALKERWNNTPERLAVREEVLDEKLKRSSRNGELG